MVVELTDQMDSITEAVILVELVKSTVVAGVKLKSFPQSQPYQPGACTIKLFTAVIYGFLVIS